MRFLLRPSTHAYRGLFDFALLSQCFPVSSIDYKSCLRVRNTLAQSELPANQRRTNVKNAFALQIHKNLLNQHIALLDDVMTTGHTLTELSRILYDAGVKRIDVWCCARTYLDSF